MKIKFVKKIVINICVLLIVLGTSISPVKANQRSISYVLSNVQVNDTTNFDYTITLSNDKPYGKVFYDNTSFDSITLYLKDSFKVIESKTISGNDKGFIIWEKDKDGDKHYTIGIRTNGSSNLLGKISLGKSEVSFNEKIDETKNTFIYKDISPIDVYNYVEQISKDFTIEDIKNTKEYKELINDTYSKPDNDINETEIIEQQKIGEAIFKITANYFSLSLDETKELFSKGFEDINSPNALY